MSKGTESRHFEGDWMSRAGFRNASLSQRAGVWNPSEGHYHFVRQAAGPSECVRVLASLLLLAGLCDSSI